MCFEHCWRFEIVHSTLLLFVPTRWKATYPWKLCLDSVILYASSKVRQLVTFNTRTIAGKPIFFTLKQLFGYSRRLRGSRQQAPRKTLRIRCVYTAPYTRRTKYRIKNSLRICSDPSGVWCPTLEASTLELLSREPFRERGVHVNKRSTNQFLISEPKHWLNYATKEVSKIVQAYFNGVLDHFFLR